MLKMSWILIALALVVASAWSNSPTANNQPTPPRIDVRPTDGRIQAGDIKKAESKSSKDEEKSSQKSPFIWGMTAEEATAIFTLALVIVGALTAIVFLCQTWLLGRTVKQANDEFFMAHRPKLIIRGVQINYGQMNKPDGIICVMVNEGDTTATLISQINVNIKSSVHAPLLIKTIPAIPPYGNVFVDIGKTVFKPEERQPIYIASSEINETLMSNLRGASHNLYFFGFVTYRDDNGNQRPHAFYWKYDCTSDKFVEIENREYAY